MSLEVRDGEIELRGARVCLIDVVHGFLGLRRSVENALGDVTGTLLYNAGHAAVREAIEEALGKGELSRDDAGFRAMVDAFRQAGFGGFEVVDVSFAGASAKVRCVDPIAFEAYGVMMRGDGEMKPVCDYTRGALAGIMTHLTGRRDRLCIETECRAKDDARCFFEVGDERSLTLKLLRA